MSWAQAITSVAGAYSSSQQDGEGGGGQEGGGMLDGWSANANQGGDYTTSGGVYSPNFNLGRGAIFGLDQLNTTQMMLLAVAVVAVAVVVVKLK